MCRQARSRALRALISNFIFSSWYSGCWSTLTRETLHASWDEPDSRRWGKDDENGDLINAKLSAAHWPTGKLWPPIGRLFFMVANFLKLPMLVNVRLGRKSIFCKMAFKWELLVFQSTQGKFVQSRKMGWSVANATIEIRSTSPKVSCQRATCTKRVLLVENGFTKYWSRRGLKNGTEAAFIAHGRANTLNIVVFKTKVWTVLHIKPFCLGQFCRIFLVPPNATYLFCKKKWLNRGEGEEMQRFTLIFGILIENFHIAPKANSLQWL